MAGGTLFMLALALLGCVPMCGSSEVSGSGIVLDDPDRSEPDPLDVSYEHYCGTEGGLLDTSLRANPLHYSPADLYGDATWDVEVRGEHPVDDLVLDSVFSIQLAFSDAQFAEGQTFDASELVSSQAELVMASGEGRWVMPDGNTSSDLNVRLIDAEGTVSIEEIRTDGDCSASEERYGIYARLNLDLTHTSSDGSSQATTSARVWTHLEGFTAPSTVADPGVAVWCGRG